MFYLTQPVYVRFYFLSYRSVCRRVLGLRNSLFTNSTQAIFFLAFFSPIVSCSYLSFRWACTCPSFPVGNRTPIPFWPVPVGAWKDRAARAALSLVLEPSYTYPYSVLDPSYPYTYPSFFSGLVFDQLCRTGGFPFKYRLQPPWHVTVSGWRSCLSPQGRRPFCQTRHSWCLLAA